MNADKFTKIFYYITSFIIGAVILILEILGTRIIAPYYGSSVFVWASLIGITLGSLAIGYFLGGFFADKYKKPDLMYVFIFSGAVWMMIIPYISKPVVSMLDFSGLKSGTFFSALILFTIPLVLFGTVSPYLVKLCVKDNNDIGKTAGILYGISTIGSFIGAVLTGFVFIPLLGINLIINISGAMLILLVIIWYVYNKDKKIILLVLLFFFIRYVASTTPQPVSRGKVLFEKDSYYGKIRVVDYNENYRSVFVDGALQSMYDVQKREHFFKYVEVMLQAVSFFGRPENILNIGLGGGSISSKLKSISADINVDNVEIDPVMEYVARKFFDFDGKVIIADGRQYIRTTKKKYDIIFIDVFSGYSLYPYLFTKEAFLSIRSILNEGGIVSINTVSEINYNKNGEIIYDKLYACIYETLKSVFKNVYMQADQIGYTNIIYFASDADFDAGNKYVNVKPVIKGEILTDNHNPLEFLASNMMEKWRNENVTRIGRDYQF
ncbi:MAG: fused MFS/spermidine synthase [Candidatus Goldbacteria bacterium]|nr:fused MFS/spermidine synthase [Candidatus Goldiibacteriota bacterium]